MYDNVVDDDDDEEEEEDDNCVKNWEGLWYVLIIKLGKKHEQAIDFAKYLVYRKGFPHL